MEEEKLPPIVMHRKVIEPPENSGESETFLEADEVLGEDY